VAIAQLLVWVASRQTQSQLALFIWVILNSFNRKWNTSRKLLKTPQTWINKNPEHLLIKAHQKTVYFIYTTLLDILRMPNEIRNHWKMLPVWGVHFTFQITSVIYTKCLKYNKSYPQPLQFFLTYFSRKWWSFIKSTAGSKSKLVKTRYKILINISISFEDHSTIEWFGLEGTFKII